MGFISFREIVEEDAEKLLCWRLMPRVADQMTTVVPPDAKLQRKWIQDCRNDPSYYHWIIQIHGEDAGFLSISDFEPSRYSTSWGYYIGDSQKIGLGATVPPYLYNWVFSRMQVDTIEVEVHERNATALAIHEFHGYVRSPDKDRTTQKDGGDWSLMALNLLKSAWQEKVRFHNFVSTFPTSEWTSRPSYLR